MTKDPAFLFYSKDFIAETAEMKAAEVGAFTLLLAHQHLHGSVPSDPEDLAPLVKMGENEFLPIWRKISYKFIPLEEIEVTPSVNRSVNLPVHLSVGRLVNHFYYHVFNDRSTKGYINKIIGTFASVIRLRVPGDEMKKEVKKAFNARDFEGVSPDKLTERLTEWLYKRFPSLVNANANVNANKEDKESKGGEGEKREEGENATFAKIIEAEIIQDILEDGGTRDFFADGTPRIENDPPEPEDPYAFTGHSQEFIVREVVKTYKKANTTYVEDIGKDYPAARKIGLFVAKKHQIPPSRVNSVGDVILQWREVVKFIMGHQLYRKYNLVQIERYMQTIDNEMSQKGKPAPMGEPPAKKSALGNNLAAASEAQEILNRLQGGRQPGGYQDVEMQPV